MTWDELAEENTLLKKKLSGIKRTVKKEIKATFNDNARVRVLRRILKYMEGMNE